MTVVITEWYGRCGNNIIQIIRATHYAYQYKHHSVILPKHPLFIKQIITLPHPKNNTIVHNIFFDIHKIPNYPYPLTLHTMKELFQTYCISILPTQLQHIKPDTSSTISIHIRSGDTFSSNPHPAYLPPPISFYLKSIQSSQNKNIIIVYEDDRNPVVKKIQQLIPHAKFQSSSLIDDIYTLAQSQHLAFGPGTFGLMIYFISPHIKHLYTPDYNTYKHLLPFHKDTTLHIIPIHNYIKNGEWKNTPQQRLLITNR